MGRKIEMIGRKFNRLSVLRNAGHNVHEQLMYVCQCDCGTTKTVIGGDLRGGYSKSCGCLQRERTSEVKTIHGHARPGRQTGEYGAWLGIIQRCLNPNNKRYSDYGGRGITVCERWRNFENFISDMGPRPSPRHSIDRRNNDRNYEPSNCRWAMPREQVLNRKKFRNNTSGFTGVFHKGNKWIARHRVNYKQIHLGCFDRPEDAAAAYRAAVAVDLLKMSATRDAFPSEDA